MTLDREVNPPSGEADKKKSRLFPRTYRKQSLRRWLIPLIAILVIIFFLPRLVDLLVPS
jgi:hypothetical protein